MSSVLSSSDIKKIGRVLRSRLRISGTTTRFEVAASLPGRALALEIHPEAHPGAGPLVSVYTATAHLQLHGCTGYVASEMLGEVTFVGELHGRLSGLTIEREGGCSLYANVDRKMLSGDFTRLGPEVMLSGIALSLTEGVLPGGMLAPAPRARRVVRRRSKA